MIRVEKSQQFDGVFLHNMGNVMYLPMSELEDLVLQLIALRPKITTPAWPEDESRIDVIGTNGNEGLHYD